MATTDSVMEKQDLDNQGGSSWDGGEAPFKASYGKLMMWYFLLSDAFTFAGFLIAYGALRFSSPTWPVPDFVFSTAPFGVHHAPLIFVTIMSFLLIISSVTMVRAVQEGHRENKNGVVFWMLLTIIGGIGFLSCQAWEWTNLIATEHMTVNVNPFGTHVESGVYLDANGKETDEVFEAGDSYLIHKAGAGHGEDHGEGDHAEHDYTQGDHAGYFVNSDNFLQRKYLVTDGPDAGEVKMQQFGPKAFGALFFFITGFHGFHVLSGVVFLIIIMVNAGSGLYMARKNGHEMVEKIGLYWHFVDLVWVFVFLVFYLL
ncbi:cytochrome c oxidase subunit 3 [Phaeodactylibacter xiamenensis]|jgi:cytochrome c oxidase subunit 3|uniref:Cytochrome oxidase subunit III n=1 Tax=Phaeodactylibacter xiamenensis TaxID=1524460 RepID=A0A098SFS4_9BACT|nr:cytochrome c oxidase subunit 3 [Phaeodactylibacter xiamenensis]KGE89772.1 cytochrome oxidase subunit III [Phaeodactylibacter xiamenensis]MCR9054045.1 cytochrome c oxidase subunit 3 [bacterium]